MPTKLVLQQRGASGLENKAEIPALENGKIDMSWLPVVGESGAAIIARGSNANGEWVRWEDGTQVCISVQTTLPPGGLNQDYVVDVTHPAVFTSALISVISTIGAQSGGYEPIGDFYANGPVLTSSATKTRVSMYSYKAAISREIYFKILTIGRWK